MDMSHLPAEVRQCHSFRRRMRCILMLHMKSSRADRLLHPQPHRVSPLSPGRCPSYRASVASPLTRWLT
jgi:hypothetical protein